ncbi:MAG TPA: hypothetical protein VGQ31_07180 [Candidatus Limnocylindrales bacterium]|jgi:hypothetical protein|nr:hypothetical protein [Candidatus Limnocylindrales bacterium]
MIAKTTPGTGAMRRATGGPGRAGRRRVPRRRTDPGSTDPGSTNERVRLITFVWSGRTGSQPVIFADRSWLQ